MGRLGQVEVRVGGPDQRVLRAPVGRERGDPDADRDDRARRRRSRPPPPRRLPCGSGSAIASAWASAEPGEDDRELVAAVAIGAVAVAEGAPTIACGDRPEERVAGRMAARVVERLEASRSIIRTASPEPSSVAIASPSSRWNAPWLRRPVSASSSARTSTARWASAFWSAIEACPANSLVSSNSFGPKWDSSAPIRPMLSVPMTSPAAAQRDDDHRLGLERRARDLDRARVEVGVVCEDGLVPVDHPAGDPDAERADVLHDHVGEPVAGDDRPPDRRLACRPGRSSASRRRPPS